MDSIKIQVYPIPNEKYYLAFVDYDMVIKWNREALALPILNALFIKQNENYQWRITSGNGLYYELMSMMDENILQMLDENYYEIMDMTSLVLIEYEEMSVSTPELDDWLEEVNSEMSEWYTSENLMEKDI